MPKGPPEALPRPLQDIRMKWCPRLLGMGCAREEETSPPPDHWLHKSLKKPLPPAACPSTEGWGPPGRDPGTGLPQHEKRTFSGLRTKDGRLLS